MGLVMTPAALRALATRVETEEPADALNEDVARALDGWWWDSGEAEWVSDEGCTTQELPDYLTDLTAAASGMPDGPMGVAGRTGGRWEAWWFFSDIWLGIRREEALADTEAAVRVALRLRALAAKIEAEA